MGGTAAFFVVVLVVSVLTKAGLIKAIGYGVLSNLLESDIKNHGSLWVLGAMALAFIVFPIALLGASVVNWSPAEAAAKEAGRWFIALGGTISSASSEQPRGVRVWNRRRF